MSQRPIDRSPDLRRLRDEGYDIEVVSGYLVMRDVPYVTAARTVARGTLVSTLTMSDDMTRPPDTHVVLFAGAHPCRADGTPITTITHASQRQDLAPGLTVDHAFSNKPTNGYGNYYEKMTTYATIIANQARAIDPSVTAKTFALVAADEESVFRYVDTASSRAGIAAINNKIALDRLVILGLGGTGSYVLDLVVKTPVKRIDLFDGDRFLQHNAFRSPGAPGIETLRTAPYKVEYFAEMYGHMRRGIVPHPYYIDEATVDELRTADFVFLCVDRGAHRKLVIERLLEWKVPFVDVGMGIYMNDGVLGGILRATTGTPARHEHIAQHVSFADDQAGEYATNIQVADLNALNATMAVLRWKKLYGFYRDLNNEHHTTYTIDVNMLLSEEHG